MTRRSPAQAAAHRGAMFLDERLGRGWRRKIRRSKLDMQIGYPGSDSCGCVLAQLYDNYSNGLEKLDVWGRQCDLGFARDPDTSWPALTAAWLEELRHG